EKLLLISSSAAPDKRIMFRLTGTVTGNTAAVPDKTAAGTINAAAPDTQPAAADPTTASNPARDLSAADPTEQTESGAPGISEPTLSAAPGKQVITLPVTFYFSFGCKTCERLLEHFFPALESKLGVKFIINKKNILRSKTLLECAAALEKKQVPMREFPALLMGDTVLQGERDIRAKLERRVKAVLSDPVLLKKVREGGSAGGRGVLPKLLFLPVLAAGLVDGINPCAFSTLIFLIVSLAYMGKHRRAIFYTGIFFTIAVFITYFLIGLGFFYVLRVAVFAPVVSLIFKYALIVLLVVFAVLSLYDFLMIKRGRAKDMLLQLPKGLKKRIHNSVRAYASSVALIMGALVLGFLVSVFELACTGQIYFPVIAAIIQTENDLSAYLYLGLYNLCFILPLIVVFGLVYAGVSSQKITTAFQKHMGTVKISLAGVFVMLAGIMIFTDFFQ
ncbi:MAG: hypothetical protein P8107_04115, partial [Spirochaetia bacterium]